jgi:hypothetical protein
LDEGEDEAVLEGGVERELEQQVLRRGPAGELASPGAAPRPQPLRVEAEEAGGGDDAAVELDDPRPLGVAEDPRVVAAGHVREAGVAEGGERLLEPLEGEDVHVRHGAVRLDVVHRLREDGALEGQAPHPARAEDPEDAGGEADLGERPDEEEAALRAERPEKGLRPPRPLPLGRGEQQAAHPLLARGLGQRAGREAVREGRKSAGRRKLPQEAPRL